MSDGASVPSNFREVMKSMMRRVAVLERSLGERARQSQVDVHDKYINELLAADPVEVPPALEAINVVQLTSSGTYTKPANLIALGIRMVGGGGAGGGAVSVGSTARCVGAGGSAGGGIVGILDAALIPATVAYTIGAGGSGGTGAGGNGGDTIFPIIGYTLNANGGSGGGTTGSSTNLTNSNPKVAAGYATTGGCPGVEPVRSSSGEAGWWFCTVNNANPVIGKGGRGGGSIFAGESGRENVVTGTGSGVGGDGAGTNAWGVGGGGAINLSGSGTARNGGDGYQGVIELVEYLSG